MPEEKKTTYVATLYKYFGKLGEGGIKEFAEELKSLSDNDKMELANAIENGSLTY